MSDTPTLLLVHGAWHGPWCWEKLTPELERLDCKWATVALPSVGTEAATLGGVAEDVAAIEAAVAEIAGDVVIVAHSYGGVPATQANYPSRVKHVVYLGAFMPDVGQSLVSLLPPGPLPPFVQGNPDGTTSVAPGHAVRTFYADVSPDVAAWAESQLRLQNGIVNVTPVTRAAWREMPSTYVVLTEDFACPTPIQPGMAKQATQSRQIAGSHSPFLAQPKVLATMLGEIAMPQSNGLRRSA
jgi:pimeloyl-ACP methyl ester carboxylesterase